jgi:hypothetical protein
VSSFLVGAVGFLGAEAWWVFRHPDPGGQWPWVLEPASGILFGMVVVLLTAAVAVGVRPRGMGWLKGAALGSAGVATGVVIGLFMVGPGNLWPIVLVLNALMLLPSLVLGSSLGEILYSLRLARS